jgi:hypothetical protein
MKYVMLIYETDADVQARTNENKETFWAAWRAYHKAMVDAGVLVSGNALQPISTATTVRSKGGKRQVQDGPYADTKEQLGGFIILELPSLDAALDWASRCPAAATGAVEVRPVYTTEAG